MSATVLALFILTMIGGLMGSFTNFVTCLVLGFIVFPHQYIKSKEDS